MNPVRPDKAPRLTGLLALALQHGLDAIHDQIFRQRKRNSEKHACSKSSDAPKEIQARSAEMAAMTWRWYSAPTIRLCLKPCRKALLWICALIALRVRRMKLFWN